LAIDQGPIVVMMENYRSGLLWKLGESMEELQKGLSLMGIKKPNYPTGFYMYLPKQIYEGVELMVHPDKSAYILDFAVKGTEPVEISILSESAEKNIIVSSKQFSDGIHQVGFKAKGGIYKALIKQGNSTVEAKLILK
jgi:hypothetical protein